MATQCFKEDEKSHCSQLCTDSVLKRGIIGAVGEDAVNEKIVYEEETTTEAMAETDGVKLARAAWWQAARCLFRSFSAGPV